MLRFRTELQTVLVWSNTVHFFACMWAISKLKPFKFVHSYIHTDSPSKRQDFFAQIRSFLTQLRMSRITNASCSPSSRDRLTKHVVVYIWLCSCVLRTSHNSNSLQTSLLHLLWVMPSSQRPAIVTTSSVPNIKSCMKSFTEDLRILL